MPHRLPRSSASFATKQNFPGDIKITGDLTAELAASANARGNGWVYLIRFLAGMMQVIPPSERSHFRSEAGQQEMITSGGDWPSQRCHRTSAPPSKPGRRFIFTAPPLPATEISLSSAKPSFAETQIHLGKELSFGADKIKHCGLVMLRSPKSHSVATRHRHGAGPEVL